MPQETRPRLYRSLSMGSETYITFYVGQSEIAMLDKLLAAAQIPSDLQLKMVRPGRYRLTLTNRQGTPNHLRMRFDSFFHKNLGSHFYLAD